MTLTFEEPKKNIKRSGALPKQMHHSWTTTEKHRSEWVAKHFINDDEHIEIRRTLNGVQLLIVVYKKEKPKMKYDPFKPSFVPTHHGQVLISMNGKLDMKLKDYEEMQAAIKEAFSLLTL